MATGRLVQQIFKRKFQSHSNAIPAVSSVTSKDQDSIGSTGSKALRGLALLGAGAAGILSFATVAPADEAEHGLESPNYPWPHSGILSSYDHASIRRGHQVYQQIREGLHYNPYFPGGAIAMPKMLNDGAVEYEDGTPATEAQMGKDVVTFLSWAAEPEMEERKLMGFKWIFVLSLALLQAAYYRRLKWSVVKSRKLVLDVIN